MADQIAAFRPNATIDLAGWTTTDPMPPATAHGQLSDNNYATRVSPNQGVGGSIKLGFTGPGGVPWTLPDRAQVRQVRPAVVTDCVSGDNGRVELRMRPYVGVTPMPYLTDVLITTAEGVKLKRLPGLPTNPWGEPWTQKDLDNLRFHMVRKWADDPDRPRVAELYLDVLWNAAPTATITGPTSPVTDTSTPWIPWTFSDPEGDAQERIHLYVYPQSVYSQPGFNVPSPDRVDNFAGVRRPSGSVWDAPQPVWSSDLRALQVGTPLPNGWYKAFLFLADRGSNGRYSAGATWEWEQNVPAPPVPTVTAVVE